MKSMVLISMVLVGALAHASEGLQAKIFVVDTKNSNSISDVIQFSDVPARQTSFAYYDIPVSTNCKVTVELATDVSAGCRSVRMFTWLFPKQEGLSLDQQKQICGPKAGSRFHTTYLSLNENATNGMKFGTDVLQAGMVEDVNLDTMKIKVILSK